MFELLSEIVKISGFLREWKGINSSDVMTSNAKVQKYFSEGKDSSINIVLIKQLRKYDYSAYRRVLDQGVKVDYQNMIIELSQKKNGILGKVFDRDENQKGEVLVRDREVEVIKEVQNVDANRVFRSLFSEDHIWLIQNTDFI